MRDDTTRRGFDSHYAQLAAPALIGLIVGAFGWLVNRLVQQIVILPLFCHSTDAFSACANGGSISWIITTIVLVLISVIFMVRFYVFRPLLVAIAVILAVWGLGDWLAGLSLVMSTLWQAIIFGLGYAVFAWLARTEKFWMAALGSAILVVLCQLAISHA